MQHHKVLVIFDLCIELGKWCPINADVGKWLERDVDCCMRVLTFKLCWIVSPTRLSKSIYSCKSLMKLNLSHKILVEENEEINVKVMRGSGSRKQNVAEEKQGRVVRSRRVGAMMGQARVEPDPSEERNNTVVREREEFMVEEHSECLSKMQHENKREELENSMKEKKEMEMEKEKIEEKLGGKVREEEDEKEFVSTPVEDM